MDYFRSNIPEFSKKKFCLRWRRMSPALRVWQAT